jgi:hypothetical protein
MGLICLWELEFVEKPPIGSFIAPKKKRILTIFRTEVLSIDFGK